MKLPKVGEDYMLLGLAVLVYTVSISQQQYMDRLPKLLASLALLTATFFLNLILLKVLPKFKKSDAILNMGGLALTGLGLVLIWI